MARHTAITVIGGREGNASAAGVALARAIGREIGRRGHWVVTGGDGGAPRAAAEGCIEAGGEAIAVLKGNACEDDLSWATWAIPTSMDLARGQVLNWTGNGVVAVEGRYGTLAEIAMALDTGRPLVIAGRQPLLRVEAVDVPTCRVLPDATPENAAAVLDHLEALIAAGARSAAGIR